MRFHARINLRSMPNFSFEEKDLYFELRVDANFCFVRAAIVKSVLAYNYELIFVSC